MRLFPRLAATILALHVAAPAHAQQSVQCAVTLMAPSFTSAADDAATLAEITSAGTSRPAFLRRGIERATVDVCRAPEALQRFARRLGVDTARERSLQLAPADLRLHYSSEYPGAWNDGALRTGVGLGTALSAGVTLQWAGLEAAFIPELLTEENLGYEIQPFVDADRSPLAHRWHGRFIDLPQRFGIEPSRRLSAGQSFVRYHHADIRTGISTQSIAWGPARRNPLLLSGTAPGFAHVFVESARPHDVAIGHAAFQLFWGRLDESDHFDFDKDNDHRLLSGALATFRPRGAEGLELGMGRLHAQSWHPDAGGGDLLLGAYRGLDADSAGLPRDLRLLALFLRWSGSGFEVYGEWARQDEWRNWLRLLNPLDDAQAYTIGVQRMARRGAIAVRLAAEISHLSDDIAHRDLGRGRETYYVSPHVPQGHTHEGQLLGAPIGPGSEAQFLGVDVFWKSARTGVSIERIRYDDDAYYAVWAQVHGPHGHDTEFSIRLDQAVATRAFSVEAELSYSIRYNRALLGLDNNNFAGYPYRKDNNVGLRLTGRWLPRGIDLSW